MTLEERIERLSRTVEDTRENVDILRSWASKLDSIRISREFMQFGETAKLRDLAKDEIRKINYVLMNDREMDSETRKAYFFVRDMHSMYLALLDRNPEAEEKELNAEVSSVEETD